MAKKVKKIKSASIKPKKDQTTKDVLFALKSMLEMDREADAELMELRKTQKELKATRELCAKSIIRLCTDIKKGIVRENPTTRYEKVRKHKFSKAMSVIANIQLRKFKSKKV